jgi:hypothetical protein
MYTPITNYKNSQNKLCNLQNKTRVKQNINFTENDVYYWNKLEDVIEQIFILTEQTLQTYGANSCNPRLNYTKLTKLYIQINK